MTYDERRELDTWFDIVKRNCERTLRSIDLMQDVLGKNEVLGKRTRNKR